MHTNYQNLPNLPGVYLFKDAQNAIIYVGKAKDLKKRVSSYFKPRQTDWKVQALIDEHANLEHIVTHTEPEALLLEAQLIRDNKPKFNVLLKTGQPFVYLLFTKEQLPQLELVRNKQQKGTYFGPFLHKRQARAAYHYIIKTFKLSLCSASIKGGCLHYHLGNCAGNCTVQFDNQEYLFRIELAKELLRGNYVTSAKNLRTRIKEHASKLEFEKAKNLNDYLQNLEVIFQTLQAKFSEKKYERDVQYATSPLHKRTIGDATLADQIKDYFFLDTAPTTIDCFDVSHFQSSYLVGSCIRFTNGIPDKNKFRRFKIKTLTRQNDYAALQEIVGRRYADPAELPDLIVIDGGKGQLNAVREVLPHVQVISLAKREETIFAPHIPEGKTIDQSTAVGRLLLGLRDYTHHFAISYHKLLRSKQLTTKKNKSTNEKNNIDFSSRYRI